MSLPIEQFGFSDSSSQFKIWENRNERREDFSEPTSVLDSVRSPSPFVSSSSTTLSSSHGGGPISAAANFSGGDVKCEFDGSSPGQEESLLELIFSGFDDIVDPDSSGFVDFDSDPYLDENPNPLYGFKFPFLEDEEEEAEKFQTLPDPETLINPNPSGSDPPSPTPQKRLISVQPAPNPGSFSAGSDSPPPKRLNSGQPSSQWVSTNPNPGFYLIGSDPPLSPPSKRFNSGQTGSHLVPTTNPNPVFYPTGSDPSLPPPPKRHNSSRPGSSSSQPGSGLGQDPPKVIMEQLFNVAAQLTGTTTNTNNGVNNNLILAQLILARLNQNLSHITPKPPFQRAALYITQALQSLVQVSSSSSPPSPQTLILRIAAYKAFSETSPFLTFGNFTANQTILESVEGFDRIHIVDFDIGFGSQWSSLIQELGLGRKRSVSLKITAFVSPSSVLEELEGRFTEESLRSFGLEVGVSVEVQFVNMEMLLNTGSWTVLEREAVAVNLPIGSVVSSYVPLILRFLKRISPNVVICSDRSCDRNSDVPFPNGVVHALEYYTSLLESLESCGNGINQDVGSSIEKYYVQPSIDRLLKNSYRWMERSVPWRSLFGQCGFSPVMLSQTTETQAECLLQRSPVRGFHLEKRQASLVLSWQTKELVAVSAWKCSRGS